MNRTETALYPYGTGGRIAVIPHKKASSGKNAFPNRYRDFSELYFNRSGFCLLRFFPATNNTDRRMYFKRFGVMTRHFQPPVLSETTGRAERKSSRHGMYHRRRNDFAVLWPTTGFPGAMGPRSQQSVRQKYRSPAYQRDIETDIGKQYQRIGDRNAYVTAEKIKNARSGFGAVIDFYTADFRRVSRRICPKTGSCIFHPESAETRTFPSREQKYRQADKTDAPKHETQRGSCRRTPAHTTAAQNDSFARNEAETEKIVIFTPRTERSVGSYDSNFPRTWKDCSTSVISDCSSARSSRPRWSRSAPTCC